MTREGAILELETMIAEYAFNADEAMALGIAVDALRTASREQVERIRGEWISLEPEIGLFECSMCDHMILQVKCNFCPSCGAPMTYKAVEMVMRRLEEMRND